MLRVANAILTAVVPAAKAPVRPAHPRVLVIRADHLGDATLSTAPLQAIRDALTPARLDVACGPWATAVFEGHPAVSEVLSIAAPWWLVRDRTSYAARVRAWFALVAFVWRIRQRKYDIGIDLRGDLRHFVWFFVLAGIRERVSSDRTGGAVLLTSCTPHVEGRHEVLRTLAIAERAGAEPIGRPTLADRELTHQRRSDLGLPERFVAIAPRGASPNRQWPPEHVAELARFIFTNVGVPLVYIGSEADAEHAARVGLGREEGFIDLAGRTTVAELIALLTRAELLVAMDSGPMHIAAALGRPIVALWGPTPVDWLPYADDAIIVRSPEACQCTGWRECRFGPGAGRCFLAITGAQVFAAVQEQLDREERSAYPAPRLL